MSVISHTDKKDTTGDAIVSRSNVSLRCGDCLHYKGSYHPAIGQRCFDRGVKTYAAAPNCYTANVSVFRKVAPDTFASLAGIISSFDGQQSRILMGLLKSAGSLEKHGYKFLQKVFFRLGDDYLDSYFAGYVLGSGLHGNLMIVGSSFFTGIKTPVIAHLDPSSVMDGKAFIKKRKSLVNGGKLYVPRKTHRNDVAAAGYTPPDIETSKELLEAMASKGIKKKKRVQHESMMEVDLTKYRTSETSRQKVHFED